MANQLKNKITEFEKKYDRKFMLLFAVGTWCHAIYCTLNPSSNFYDSFFYIHLAGLWGTYVLALLYTAIFVFWKKFH